MYCKNCKSLVALCRSTCDCVKCGTKEAVGTAGEQRAEERQQMYPDAD